MSDNLMNLFESVEKVSPNSLFVLHNSTVAKMKIEKIFDAQRYKDLKAVSYVSSPKFFAETVKNFQSVTLIMGIDKVNVLNQFSAYFDSKEQVEFFNELPYETKNLVIADKIKIRYGKYGVMIHDKIYLMSNEETGDYRVIVGSANLTNSAFDSANRHFEDIRIDDSKELYEIYLERFKFLLEQTNDYIPEICRRNYKENKSIIVCTPEVNAEIFSEKYKEQFLPVVITEKEMEQFQNSIVQTEEQKRQLETSKRIVEEFFEKKDKNGNFKIKPPATLFGKKNILREIYHRTFKRKKKFENDIRELLLMDKNTYALYKKFSDDKEALIYSQPIETSKIKTTLEKINSFTQAYFDFAVTPNIEISSKIYELILYAFTAPFIWKIRQKFSTIYDKSAVADIPMFCILGGVRESGKTTALRFAAKLLGQMDGKQIYDYSRELDTAGIIFNMIKENNSMPIFADEISLNFFKRSNSTQKGEEMIKSLANEIPHEPAGTLIGTTNLSEFSSSGQIVRRIYYLEVSSMFNSKKKRESVEYLREINENLDDALFKDFTYRFSRAICDNEELFKIEDFLMLTRKIFLSYYEESGVEIPKYFPRQIFSDYENRKIKMWRDLFFANRNCFIDKGEKIQVNIDEIFKNSTNVKAQKDRLINFLDENCIASDFGIGVNWFLKTDKFYEFIDYQPTFLENVKNSVQKIFQ